MTVNRAACRRGHRRASDITQGPAPIDLSEHPIHEVERSLILRLFLAPDQFGLGMLGERLADALARMRVELFNTDQSDVRGAFPRTPLIQAVKDLSGAKDDPVTRTRSLCHDNGAKSRARRQLRQRRLTFLLAQ